MDKNGFNKLFSPGASKKSSRIFYFVISILLILILTVLAGGPLAIKWFIQKELADAGAVNTEIENIDFNPFTAVVRLESFHGATDQEKDLLTVGEFYVKYQWIPFLDRRIFIKKLVVKNSEIHITRLQDGTYKIGSLHFPEKKNLKRIRKKKNGGWDFMPFSCKTSVFSMTFPRFPCRSRSKTQKYPAWRAGIPTIRQI